MRLVRVSFAVEPSTIFIPADMVLQEVSQAWLCTAATARFGRLTLNSVNTSAYETLCNNVWVAILCSASLPRSMTQCKRMFWPKFCSDSGRDCFPTNPGQRRHRLRPDQPEGEIHSSPSKLRRRHRQRKKRLQNRRRRSSRRSRWQWPLKVMHCYWPQRCRHRLRYPRRRPAASAVSARQRSRHPSPRCSWRPATVRAAPRARSRRRGQT